MNAFFPYAGSSKKYARFITEIIRREGYTTYAEPMVGSGAVFFQLAPIRAFICDIEWLHINLYRQAKERPEEVIAELDHIPPVKDWLVETQEIINSWDADPRTAATWYALLILCYNGVVQKKNGNPYLTWGDRHLTWVEKLPVYKQRILVVSQMLQGVDIYCADYKLCPTADIAFFDPPWIGSKEDYGVDFWHPHLKEHLRYYHGKWVLTINDCEEARDTYLPIATWSMKLKPYYSVSPSKKGRFKRTELLITNFQPKMFGDR